MLINPLSRDIFFNFYGTGDLHIEGPDCTAVGVQSMRSTPSTMLSDRLVFILMACLVGVR